MSCDSVLCMGMCAGMCAGRRLSIVSKASLSQARFRVWLLLLRLRRLRRRRQLRLRRVCVCWLWPGVVWSLHLSIYLSSVLLSGFYTMSNSSSVHFPSTCIRVFCGVVSECQGLGH